MAAPTNPIMGFQPEMQDITRQRKLSELLLAQGMQGSKGQMVGNIYVPSHPLENIADAYAIYKSGRLSKDANTKEQDLAKQLRDLQATESTNILGALEGKPEQTVYGAGMEGPTMNVKPAIAGSREAALAEALKGRSPFSQTMATKLLEQKFKDPKFEKIEQYDAKTGNTMVGMINVNSPNPEATYRPIGVSKPAMSQKDMLELRDKGISVGGGTVSGVVPMGGGQVNMQAGGQKVTGDAKYMPTTLPTYEYDPNLSPAQNREAQSEFSKDLRKNVKNAKDTFGTIQAASEILNSGDPSSGFFENALTTSREAFGGGGKQSETDKVLKVLEQKLVQQVPRFEGPQSDKDVASYKAAAGDIGNPNTPIRSRLAAMKILVDLNKKYYPNGDWDSIDLSGPIIKKNMLGGGNTYFGARALSPQERAAAKQVQGVDSANPLLK